MVQCKYFVTWVQSTIFDVMHGCYLLFILKQGNLLITNERVAYTHQYVVHVYVMCINLKSPPNFFQYQLSKGEDGGLQFDINATAFYPDIPSFLGSPGLSTPVPSTPWGSYKPGYFHVLMAYHSDIYSYATLMGTHFILCSLNISIQFQWHKMYSPKTVPFQLL